MKNRLFASVAAFVLGAGILLAGCTAPASSAPAFDAASDSQSAAALTPQPAKEKEKGETIPASDINPDGGADAYAGGGDNPASRYYVNMDFYNAKSDEMLTILPKFKTCQQTAEWSCGNVAALMALYWLGNTGYIEYEIAEAMGSHTDKDVEGAKPGTADNFYEYGTNVQQMTLFFEGIEGVEVLETSYRADYAETDLLTEADGVSGSYVGNLPGAFSPNALYTSENDPASEAYVEDAKDSYFVKWLTGHLNNGDIIMTEWCDWDGHWTVLIGYDNNGTPGIGDDILIFADPYDTSDHWQDGYAIAPLERWFYMWNDRTVAPRPFQIQPYLVVGQAA